VSLKDATNAHYDENRPDWALARDFYQLERLTRHLRRGKFEAPGPWKARQKDAFSFQFTRQIINNFADQLLLRADEVERELGPIPSSYVEAAGPEEESHNLQMHQLGVYLLLFGECWLQIRPTGDGGGELRVLTPLTVPRWKDEKVVTLGERSRPNVPIEENEEVDTSFTVHSPRGFTTYMFREKKNGEEEKVQVESGTYSPDEDRDAFFVSSDGTPTPPLVKAQMPWDLNFGALVAEVHRAMYQEESQMRSRLRSANTAGMWTTTGLDADGEEKVDAGFKQGSNLYHLPEDGELNPIEFPTTPVEQTKEHLEWMEKRLYKTASMAAQQAAANSSATETVVRDKGGAAVTATLASTVESAEENALRLLSQAVNIVDFGGGATPPQDPNTSANWTDIDWSESSVSLAASEDENTT